MALVEVLLAQVQAEAQLLQQQGQCLHGLVVQTWEVGCRLACVSRLPEASACGAGTGPGW